MPVASLPTDEEYLTNRGWKQGSRLPAVAHTVLCDADQRLSVTSRACDDFRQVIGGPGEGTLQPYQVATGISRKGAEYFVIISQTCDIARSITLEPTIVAMRALITRNPTMLNDATRSTRTFLLNRDAGLIADASQIVQIEKPVLLTFEPQDGPVDAATARSFRRWLGMRYMRPGYPTGFELAVRQPMGTALLALEEAQDARMVDFSKVELRITSTGPRAPYAVNIVALIPPSLTTEHRKPIEHAAHSIIGELLATVDRSQVQEPTFVLRAYDEINAAEYLSTDEFLVSSPTAAHRYE